MRDYDTAVTVAAKYTLIQYDEISRKPGVCAHVKDFWDQHTIIRVSFETQGRLK